MVNGAEPLMRQWPGLAATALVAGVTMGTLATVASRADGWGTLGPSDWVAIRFTLVQAAVSAVISVVLAVPLARALARRNFPGKAVLVTLLGAPFILPIIVAVLGLLAVFGRSGIVSAVLGWVGLPPIHIYGFHGVVLAHVFFNMPLATRLILQGWIAIPAERFRLAGTLGFSSRDVTRTLEWPMLRRVLPGAMMVIFLICTTSFAVVLALGGGPKATTVELAIYQAFRFDFDLGRAAMLGLVQFAICGIAAIAMFLIHTPEAFGGGVDRPVQRWDGQGQIAKMWDGSWIFLASAFLIFPLIMIVAGGLSGLTELPQSVVVASIRSVSVALGSIILTLTFAFPMAIAIQRIKSRTISRMIEAIGYLSVAASPLVIGTGLFILIFRFADPATWALPITALVNAVMSLPFALRALVPAVAEIDGRFAKLADSLNLNGIARMRSLYLPRLRRPLGFSAGLAGALSMGDLGAIALFSDPNSATLPMQLYRLMAAYRMEQAGAVALILLALSLLVFWVFDRGGRVDADT